MATALKGELSHLKEEMARFAKQHIASRDDLHALDAFPRDIWGKMGEENLLGINLPKEYGGRGGNSLSLAVAGEILTQKGHNLGIAVSWLIHHVVSRFLIMDFGDNRQHEMYLNRLASGRITPSIAVSEPKRGTHPKYIETSANRQGDSFVLNGEKTYLTNGPIADLFIVIGITEVSEGKKRFTAFIVPKETEGLSLTEPMKLDFFRPAPHGGIVLSRCLVPASNILGKEGFAYEKMVKPFRDMEDALMMGPMIGGIESQFEVLLSLIVKQGIDKTDDLKKDLGRLQSIIHTLRIIAYEGASMVDSPVKHPEFLSLLVSFRHLSRQFQDLFELLVDSAGIEYNTALHRITNDMVHGIGIGKNIAQLKLKKIGEKRLSGKESDELA
ncbi:MAG: acyl-CoA dehydrogenase family protein [Thermodesulfobacteriota bacterium]|nr:acyl-CoA dehydrogenase family protein [Thermodesulfobacteriota bacterium]